MKKPIWLLILISAGSAVIGAALGLGLWTIFSKPVTNNSASENNQNQPKKDLITDITDKISGKASIDRAKQSEAKTYVGSLNRSQEAFYLEKQQFAPNLEMLATGIPSETANYSYTINRIDPVRVQNYGIAKRDGLRTYIGGVIITKSQVSSDLTSLTTICESDQPTTSLPPPIIFIEGQSPKCPSGYSEVG